MLLIAGQDRGSLVVTTAPDGVVSASYDVHWNGRGPHCDATIHLASDGTLAAYEAQGHHMLGNTEAESFAVEGGRAHWKNIEETGDATANGATFFVPISDDPEVMGLLAEALHKTPGGSLGLWPSGKAQIEQVGDIVLHAGERQQHVTAYAITGVEMMPVIEWLDDTGAWFAFSGQYRDTTLVPEGWESAAGTLFAKKLEIDRDRDRLRARRLAHTPPDAGLAFSHARVLDVERGRWVLDQTVVIAKGLIVAVGPTKSTKVSDGAEVVDLGGKALLPGLWDMHQHFQAVTGALDIASGVTTARDTGNEADLVDDFKKRFDDGDSVGPHLLRAGLIEGRGEKAAASKITAETEEEAKAGVDFYAKRGWEMIKIYNSVKPELVPIITKAAHDRGMTVTGHIPFHMLANEAVRAGYDGIEHVNQLLLNFFADHDTDTRMPLRFSLVGDKAGDLDLASKPAIDFFRLLSEHRTVVDPTFGIFEALFDGQPGKAAPGLDWIIARLPIQAQRQFFTEGLASSAEKAETYRRSFANMLRVAAALRDAKVEVVAGTDSSPPGLMLERELELFVRGGLSPTDALRDATIIPARVMRLDKKTGSIAPGKAADLFVVDGDPLANISDVRKVVTTVRGGVVFDAKATLDTVGVKYWQ